MTGEERTTVHVSAIEVVGHRGRPDQWSWSGTASDNLEGRHLLVEARPPGARGFRVVATAQVRQAAWSVFTDVLEGASRVRFVGDAQRSSSSSEIVRTTLVDEECEHED